MQGQRNHMDIVQARPARACQISREVIILATAGQNSTNSRLVIRLDWSPGEEDVETQLIRDVQVSASCRYKDPVHFCLETVWPPDRLEIKTKLPMAGYPPEN